MEYKELCELSKTYIKGYRTHLNCFLVIPIMISCICTLIGVGGISGLYEYKNFFISFMITTNLASLLILVWGTSTLIEGIVEEDKKISYQNIFRSKPSLGRRIGAFLINVGILVLVIGTMNLLYQFILEFEFLFIGIVGFSTAFIVIVLVLSTMIEPKINSLLELVKESWRILLKYIKLFLILIIQMGLLILGLAFGVFCSLFTIMMLCIGISQSGIIAMIPIIVIFLIEIAIQLLLIFLVIPPLVMKSYIIVEMNENRLR